MSNRSASPYLAFHSTIKHYANCRTSTASGAHAVGFYASLSNSVSSMTGKVHVCASDLIADVELAANKALRDFPAERRVFQRIYLDGDTEFKEVFAKHLGSEPFDSLTKEIESRVGQEFVDRGIYPIREYVRVVDVR